MSEVIRPTDPGVLERCRAAGTDWVELATEDLEVFERVHHRLQEIAESANAIANRLGKFRHSLTSGFTPKGGVRGSQPKDLWFAIYRENAPLGMPQLYMIVSSRGVEYGFAPAIHPSDFSSQSHKQKLRALIPSLFSSVPSADSVVVEDLSESLKNTGSWYFRQKARQDPLHNDFSDLPAFIDFLHSRKGLNWGAGAICRYVRPDQLSDVDLNLRSDFERIVDLFVPLMNVMMPGDAALAVDNLAPKHLQLVAGDVRHEDAIGPLLEKFLETYGSVRQQPYRRDDGLWSLMNLLKARIADLQASQKRPSIIVEWSVGKGKWAGIPHISFLDQRETTSTQRGVYAVLLFREDLSGVYLTLNQGVTEFTNEYPRSEARRILRERANHFGALVPELTKLGFSIDPDIDLRTEGDLGLDYEASTIAYKLYSRGATPSDAEIAVDLDQVLECYERLLKSKEPARKSWIFQANPEKFDVEGALAELDELSWLINQHKDQIHEGDEVFIWKSGVEGGIIGVATVLTEPYEGNDLPDERPFNRDEEKFEGLRLRVRLRVDEVLASVLKRNEIASKPGLSDLAILKMAQVTNSPVTIDQSKAVWNIIREQKRNAELPAASNQKIWLVSAGRNAEKWEEFYRNSSFAIGWHELGDLSQFETKQEIAQELQRLGWESDARNDAATCYDFAHAMREGDLILVKKGRSSIVGYGIITGPYSYDATLGDYPNTRTVRWQGRGEWNTDRTLALKAVTNITLRPDLVEHLKSLIGAQAEPSDIAPLPTAERRRFSIEDALDGLFITKEEFEDVRRTWLAKKNLILQGAPGVGKTFIAERLAFALMGYADQSRVRRIQFHQSYSYEDFIQGSRPSSAGFERKNGIFYDFCKQAILDMSNDYVFIIDEINRGNLSKIFGELMVLIEPDKRDPRWAVPLTYAKTANEQFYIPKNVYLLGMMNTADRSLSMVDYALRRRFAFHTLKSQITAPSYKATLIAQGVPDNLATAIIDRVGALNTFISNKAESSLGAGFCIGHSFFMPHGDSGAWDQSWYRRVIETEVIPLLAEYWFDDDDRVEEWRSRLLAVI